MKLSKNLPDHALVVNRYSEFRDLIQAFVDGHHELMTLVGNPGLAKSEEVKRKMQEGLGGKGWSLLTGKHSPLDLYRSLFRSRLLPIVLDDLDGLFASADNTAILKCVCDTQPVKRVEWGSFHAAFQQDDCPLPAAFESISRVCIIANDLQQASKNIAAIRDRGLLVVFDPSPLEVHREVGEAGWFDDSEVFDFIGKNLFLIMKPSMRVYITARNHKRSGLDWRDLTLRTIEKQADEKLLLVARLLADTSYDDHSKPEAERERAFREHGGGSRATYHRYKRQLLKWRALPEVTQAASITLCPPRPDMHSLAISDRRRQLEAMRDEQFRSIETTASASNEGPTSRADEPARDESAKEKKARLRRQMKEAIAREDYELAAKIRDEIQELTD